MEDRFSQGEKVSLLLFDRDNEPCRIVLSNTRIIGKGTFGRVFEVHFEEEEGTKREKRHDVKTINPGHWFVRRSQPNACLKITPSDHGLIIERDLLLKVSHQNIIHLMYHNVFERTLYLVLDLMDDDMFSVIRRARRKRQSLGIYVQLYAYQMFKGLAYLADLNIIHRDMKTENLLVQHSRGNLKIADFGLSTEYKERREYGPYVGTRDFRAPEQIAGSRHYGPKIDTWAGGVVLTELILYNPIFGSISASILQKVISFLGPPTQQDMDEWQLSEHRVFNLRRRTRELVAPTQTLEGMLEREAARAQVVVDYQDLLLQLLRKVLVYSPRARPDNWDVAADPYFDKLRQRSAKLPNGRPLPHHLFEFTSGEVKSMTKNAREKFAWALR